MEKLFFHLVELNDDEFLERIIISKRIKRVVYVEFEPSVESDKKMIVVSSVFADDDKKGDEPIGVIISRMRTTAIDNVFVR